MSAVEWIEWVLLLAGMAFLHLTWQTVVVGAGVGALDRLGRRISPQLRYSIGLALYASLPLIALGTAGWLAGRPGAELAPVPTTEAFPGRSSWAAAAAPWLGLLWCAGAAVSWGGLVAGARRSVRLARDSRRPGPALADSSRSQIGRMGMRRAPAVRISDRVRVPTVVGLFSPTILFPVRLPERMGPDEVEAMLAHELAHVRRRDLFASAVQRAVSGVLFHHPVARWVSRRLDRDRELCCDDLVTTGGVSPRTYARALARTALSGRNRPALGIGLGTGDVAARVRRLVESDGGRPPARLGGAARLAPAGIVAVVVAAATALTAALLPATARAARTAPAWQLRTLADGGGSYTINATDPAGRFTLSVEGGRAVGATIDGRPLSSELIRQRGARVTLGVGQPEGTFSVQLVPSGGIQWPARPPRSRPR